MQSIKEESGLKKVQKESWRATECQLPLEESLSSPFPPLFSVWWPSAHFLVRLTIHSLPSQYTSFFLSPLLSMSCWTIISEPGQHHQVLITSPSFTLLSFPPGLQREGNGWEALSWVKERDSKNWPRAGHKSFPSHLQSFNFLFPRSHFYASFVLSTVLTVEERNLGSICSRFIQTHYS